MFNFSFGGDFFIVISLFILNLILINLFSRKFSLIHLLIVIDVVIITASILLPASISTLTCFPDGELFSIFSIAVAAAETALVLSIYLFLRKNNLLKIMKLKTFDLFSFKNKKRPFSVGFRNNPFNKKNSNNFIASASIKDTIKNHFVLYPTPTNISYVWSFGSLAGFCLFLQLISGIFLAMHYCSDSNIAFASVEHIIRDVSGGWFIRYLHANGASAFFAVVYLHMFKGLVYSSYRFSNFKVWLSGMIIFLLIIATAFIGYVLPWGQISFWGATVITNFFSVVPFVGTDLVQWLWGGFAVGGPTLSRFFSLHYLLPFFIVAAVILHFHFLHNEGSSNPFPIEHRDSNFFYLPLYPYFMVKDLVGLLIFCFILSFFIFFEPNILGHSDNYIEANSIVTPEHIVPEWYFLPFYAILRSIPNKTLGIIAIIASILSLALLTADSYSLRTNPQFFFWFRLDVTHPTFRRVLIHNFIVATFACNFILLGFIGARPVEEPYLTVGFWLTISYFILLELLILSGIRTKFSFVRKNIFLFKILKW